MVDGEKQAETHYPHFLTFNFTLSSIQLFTFYTLYDAGGWRMVLSPSKDFAASLMAHPPALIRDPQWAVVSGHMWSLQVAGTHLLHSKMTEN